MGSVVVLICLAAGTWLWGWLFPKLLLQLFLQLPETIVDVLTLLLHSLLMLVPKNQAFTAWFS
jgi:hypothetical protein